MEHKGIFVCLQAIWLFSTLVASTEYVKVTTKLGDIEGYVSAVNVDGNVKQVIKFLGIPYAEPPTASNRFQKPIPKANFTSTYLALEFPPSCIQVIDRIPLTLSEDCLYLNVYVPKMSAKTSLPVMVWIHGGAFVSGASSMFQAEALSAYGEVVIVTINYRLEMFGFLRSSDGSLVGNQGLWDQQLAIKWVHDNIASFNGDPNEVTIFGESAGSASVLFQALYPGNIGYFKRVIAESGAALAYWAINPPNADVVEELNGCNNSSNPVFCLQLVPPLELQSKSLIYKGQEVRYTPCVDNDFLLESPHDIIYGNNVKSEKARAFFASLDILTGVNNLDGALYLINIWPTVLNETFPHIHLNREQFLKIVVPLTAQDVLKPKCKKVLEQAIDAIAFEYTDWSDPDNQTKVRDKLIELSSDIAFHSPAVDTVRGHAGFSKGRTYFYEFALSLTQHALLTPDYVIGSNHADEIAFVFGYPISDVHKSNRTYTDEQRAVSRAMMSIWTNFAKTRFGFNPRICHPAHRTFIDPNKIEARWVDVYVTDNNNRPDRLIPTWAYSEIEYCTATCGFSICDEFASDPNKPLPVQKYLGGLWPQYNTDKQMYVQFTESLSTDKIEHNFEGSRMAFWLDYIPTILKHPC